MEANVASRNPWPWRIVQAIYSDIKLSTIVDGEYTRFVPAEQGVRQGCPLSPVLFDIFVDELVTMLKARTLGLAFNGSDNAKNFARSSMPTT